eukprot:12057951-Alexandrium_andersonii.AAC.2
MKQGHQEITTMRAPLSYDSKRQHPLVEADRAKWRRYQTSATPNEMAPATQSAARPPFCSPLQRCKHTACAASAKPRPPTTTSLCSAPPQRWQN